MEYCWYRKDKREGYKKVIYGWFMFLVVIFIWTLNFDFNDILSVISLVAIASMPISIMLVCDYMQMGTEFELDKGGISRRIVKRYTQKYVWTDILDISVCDVHHATKAANYDMIIRIVISQEKNGPLNKKCTYTLAGKEHWRGSGYALRHMNKVIELEYSKQRYDTIKNLSGKEIVDRRTLEGMKWNLDLDNGGVEMDTPKLPPLSKEDNIVYNVALFVVLFLIIGLVKIVEYIPNRIAYTDATVIAYNSVVNVITFFVCGIFVFGIVIIAVGLMVFYLVKYPLWGDSNITYGGPEWDEVYPLFGDTIKTSKKYKWIDPKKAFKRIGIALIIAILLYPLTIFERECLHKDGTISIYDAFNKEIVHTKIEDIQRITVYSKRIVIDETLLLEKDISFRTKDKEEYTFSINYENEDIHEYMISYNEFLSVINKYPKEIIKYKSRL